MNATPRQQTNIPTPDEIAVCAFAIWEKEGRPHGRDVEHWLQAEAQLTVDHRQDSLRSVREAIAVVLAENRAKHAPVLRKSTAKVGGRSRIRTQALLAE
ncbi:MAG: DUF2934 domain-containing protein [Verrucomicrobiia bacterium]|jgi:hypothetical protein